MGVATHRLKNNNGKRFFAFCKRAEGFKAEETGKKRAQNMHGKINYLGEKKKMKPRRSELKQQQVILPWLYNALV